MLEILTVITGMDRRLDTWMIAIAIVLPTNHGIVSVVDEVISMAVGEVEVISTAEVEEDVEGEGLVVEGLTSVLEEVEVEAGGAEDTMTIEEEEETGVDQTTVVEEEVEIDEILLEE